MTVDDEQDLRKRLGLAFGAITPHPAPVAGAVRHGAAIRARQRAMAAVGFAAVVAAAVAIPVLLAGRAGHPAPAGPVRSHNHAVTVHPGGAHALRGLIGWGSIAGRQWQVRLTAPGSSGVGRNGQCVVAGTWYCGPAVRYRGPGPAELTVAGSGTGAGSTVYVYGPVAANVTVLRASLAGGAVLTLHPVRAYGVRAVAFAAPAAAIGSVTAYSRRGELAAATPFHGPHGTVTFSGWLRPGQRGLPEATALIGSGRAGGTAWSVRLYQGPWGRCFLMTNLPPQFSPGCVPGSAPMGTSLIGWTAGPPLVAYGSASGSVAQVVITLPGGARFQVPAVSAAGQKYFAFAIDKRVRALRWTAYDDRHHTVATRRVTV